MNKDKFLIFWRRYGPYFLFGTAFSQILLFENFVMASLFIILGFMLITDND